MADLDELYLADMEDEVRGIERLLELAAERARRVEGRSLLNGKKQSVTSLRKHLEELQKDARDLREGFRGRVAEITEDVDEERLDEVRKAKDTGGAP